MKPAALRKLIAQVLTAVGHDEAYWLERIGEVEKRPSVENIHSNWRVSPSATGKERHAIANAVEIVRSHHPYVD